MTDQLPEPYGTKPLTNQQVVVKDSAATLKEYPNLYSAGTEPLAGEEMRITALGTGYPARPGQASSRPARPPGPGRKLPMKTMI